MSEGCVVLMYPCDLEKVSGVVCLTTCVLVEVAWEIWPVLPISLVS